MRLVSQHAQDVNLSVAVEKLDRSIITDGIFRGLIVVNSLASCHAGAVALNFVSLMSAGSP